MMPVRKSSLMHEQIRVRGLVQGVGFRPTVFRIARELGIDGEVCNDGEGILIDVQSEPSLIDTFIQQLQQQCPPLARIDCIERLPAPDLYQFEGFTIKPSQHGYTTTGIVPDAATCSACLEDIREPFNRRYGYAFTNCTHCGPRLSIIKNIPYDRGTTSMQAFTMCEACQREYNEPTDRRFHAQPNACPDCGPFLSLVDKSNQPVPGEDPIAQTAHLIRQGHIVAIKGIGGFQLACDAQNDQAVILLRRRKRRPHKSLALMAADLRQISDFAEPGDDERSLLQSATAPIVILRQKPGTTALSPHIAPAQNTLGFMLPYSPLHHLLMQQLDGPIVLTSGNAAEEPQCIDNRQAMQTLSQIADYFLLHNRDIVNRIDDSVMRVIDGQAIFYRRARGYAPQPIALAQGFESHPQVLALGGELKNSFCLLKARQLTLSQHMGNLENLQTYDDYQVNLSLYQRLFEFTPEAIVIDRHPEYLSSKLGRQLAYDHDLPLIEVQHHHAHVAACLADNHWPLDGGKVIGIALDGIGLGDDGHFWGGEFLLADYYDFQRLAHFKPVAMAGGSQAIYQPWRNTLAQLLAYDLWDQTTVDTQLELFDYLKGKPHQTLRRMIDKGINAPLASSCGRLFDAVAVAVGLCRESVSFEGQAAMELEALVEPHDLLTERPYPFELVQSDRLEINSEPMWKALLHDLTQAIDSSRISARFHLCVSQMIAITADKLSRQTGVTTFALSGGVFQNATLFALIRERLIEKNLQVLSHRQVPANDGGLSLGQAAIAAARLKMRT